MEKTMLLRPRCRPNVALALGFLACLLSACTIRTLSTATDGGGIAGDDDAGIDAGTPACNTGQSFCNATCIDTTEDDANCGGCAVACTAGKHCADGSCQASKIEHVVLIVQENHTFDAYFGRYCEAASGSNPTCTKGPTCCERAPDKEPHGASPVVLDDTSNFANDRDHRQACEIQQINNGRMDRFVTGSTGADTCFGFGPDCASQNNWALAGAATVGAYWALADGNSLADRYFQPIVGGTSSNNMYFAAAHFQFVDNDAMPNSIGSGCTDQSRSCLTGAVVQYQGRKTIGDLLVNSGKTFGVYAGGYAEAKRAAPSCPAPSSNCPYSSCTFHPIACHACIYDPADIPFLYYEQFVDKPNIKDYLDLKQDLDNHALPNFSFVKAREWTNEHPNVSTITDGISFVANTIQSIENSSYADSTLILVTWDEGGGFFDHIAPPASIDVDLNGSPVLYGTRVPLLAIGKFARKGTVSHVQMEHSSIVRFLEYNFVGAVGQLGHNDAKVNNIGSMLDPKATGIRIPEN
jgi:phospholipase C